MLPPTPSPDLEPPLHTFEPGRDPGASHLDFLAIVGPTASGKTGLSLEVGSRLDGEIISMDSRQVYRGMDIGTGKVTLRERALLPHHGLDLCDPSETYSAGQFARDARRWIQGIKARGRKPILVGGTGFFLKALTEPMFKEPELDQERRARLRTFLNELPQESLAEYIKALDPVRENALGGGRQRATRTIEMALLTGRPLSWWHRASDPSEDPMKALVVLLDPPRELLYEKINRRVEGMIAEGLVEEVKGLLEAGFGSEDPGMTGAGYREIILHLQGELTLEEATEEIQRSHRRYARRQITWFRHQLPPDAMAVEEEEPGEDLVDRVVAAWTKRQGRAEI